VVTISLVSSALVRCGQEGPQRHSGGWVIFVYTPITANTGANDGTIAHEIGHAYGLAHRNDSTHIEGFQVFSMRNRSYVETNGTSGASVSLMHEERQDPGKRWIDNDDYATLLASKILQLASLPFTASERLLLGNYGGLPRAGYARHATPAQAGYLIIQGTVDPDAGTAFITLPFLQEVPNDTPPVSGSCNAALYDTIGTLLSNVLFEPGSHLVDDEISNDGDDLRSSSLAHAEQSAGGFFHASLPWNASASELRISCNGSILLSRMRSAHPPLVDILNVHDGDVLSGAVTVQWSGSDLDTTALAYQLQVYDAPSGLWNAQTSLTSDTQALLDTQTLPSGDDVGIRVLVTDGFDSAYSTRNVKIRNGLTLLSRTHSPTQPMCPSRRPWISYSSVMSTKVRLVAPAFI